MITHLIAAVAAAQSLAEADLSWLSGDWRLCEPDRIVEERWLGPRAGVMVGASLTFEGGRTSFEFMRLQRSATGWAYLASPGGRSPPTAFPLVEATPGRAVFANPDHDFPQRLIYQRDGADLRATIEGPLDGRTVSETWRYSPGTAEGCR